MQYANCMIQDSPADSSFFIFSRTFLEALTAFLAQAELFIKKYGRTYGLKALDALHLGDFSLISEKDWSFVVAYDNLCKVAAVIDFTTINLLKVSAKKFF